MKHIGFVFSQVPHGNASGREGLDALLSMSALTDNISVFFISDGIFQLLPYQEPHFALARDYISTFKVLTLYEIKSCYICAESIRSRGLNEDISWIIDVKVLEKDVLCHHILQCDHLLTF